VLATTARHHIPWIHNPQKLLEITFLNSSQAERLFFAETVRLNAFSNWQLEHVAEDFGRLKVMTGDFEEVIFHLSQ